MLGERLGFDIQLGQQRFNSSFTSESRARFINSSLNWSLSKHYFLGLGATGIGVTHRAITNGS